MRRKRLQLVHFNKFFFGSQNLICFVSYQPQVASPLQYQSINTQTGDENTKTDQLKDAILPNIKFSKPVLKEMYRSKKGELLIRSWS